DLGWNGPAYAARARAFGWHAIELDGHDLQAIDRAYAEALEQKDQPTVLVAKTEKGHGVPEVADKDGWHGKALPPDLAKKAIAVLGKTAFASTFAAFFTRAYDQIRMAAVSNATIRLSGSHAGVSIGEDGPSQMGLEDLAMMRAVCGSNVLYPCDANQTAQLVRLVADLPGISILRTTREKTPIRYEVGEEF